MEKIAEFDDHDAALASVREQAPHAQRLPDLEEALRNAADYMVWLDRTTGMVWWSAPEEGDAPPIVLWREPAGEAAPTFEGILDVFGYVDRVGDETGNEYREWAENGNIDVDADYDVLGELWELYRVDAEQLAPAVGLSTGQYLDRQLGAELTRLDRRRGYLAARRAAHIRSVYGSERGWLAAASRDLGLAHPTVREVVLGGDQRQDNQRQALAEHRQEDVD